MEWLEPSYLETAVEFGQDILKNLWSAWKKRECEPTGHCYSQTCHECVSDLL